VATTRSFDVELEGLGALLRAMNKLDPEMSKQMRDKSNVIATDIMAPAYQQAASSVPIWGGILSSSIRAKRDRVPSVSIGYTRRAMAGGASSAMVRYATSTGEGRNSFAPFERTNWIQEAKSYKPAAIDAWIDAVESVVTDFNNGGGV